MLLVRRRQSERQKMSIIKVENSAPDDVLVPDPLFAEQLGITLRTLARWDEDPRINTPPSVKIRGRKYRWRSACNAFKALPRRPSREAAATAA